MCGLNEIVEIDVVVVGLGPAGASAAMAAAKNGSSVLALERNASPGLPVQCAEFVPLLIAAGKGLEAVNEASVQNIERMETYVEKSAADITLDFRGQMIDRAAFDCSLIKQAEANGASCSFSSPVRQVRKDGLVEAVDGRLFRAKVIIGADGPRSPVAQSIGSSNVDLVETRQITVPLKSPHNATDIFLCADIPGGYGWLFPKDEVANLGLGVVPAHKHLLKPILDNLHAKLVAEGRVGTEILAHTGGLIPVGGIQKSTGMLGETPVMLVGDAVGLTNPVTGAGINSAVISGHMAGDAAFAWIEGDEEAARDYAEEVNDLFGPSIARAVARRRQILSAYEGGEKPTASELRSGWIAYPQYWSRDGLELSTSAVTAANDTRKSA